MSETPAIAGFRVVSQDAWEAGLAACEEYRSKLDKLERENAALRQALEEAFAESDDTVRFHIIRNAVEALKEAQP